MNKLIATIVVAVGLAFAASAPAAAQGNQPANCQQNPAASGCTAVQNQAGRNTAGGAITTYADHCDTALRRTGEPLVFTVVPQGARAFDPNSRALPGLSWAATSMAGERFRDLGLRFDDQRVIVETELCASVGVWWAAMNQLGITLEDVRQGRVWFYLCGERYAHLIPQRRIIDILEGRTTRGQYSVLSVSETDSVAAELTRRGF